jgi:hypothetical protein
MYKPTSVDGRGLSTYSSMPGGIGVTFTVPNYYARQPSMNAMKQVF